MLNAGKFNQLKFSSVGFISSNLAGLLKIAQWY
jgi:hypothetical protein